MSKLDEVLSDFFIKQNWGGCCPSCKLKKGPSRASLDAMGQVGKPSPTTPDLCSFF
jgi:hypothetical protein